LFIVGTQMTMVRVQQHQGHNEIPKEVKLSGTAPPASSGEIEQRTYMLIEDAIVGDGSRIEMTLAQIAPTKKYELELMAKVIISKALDEPQHCKACVSLSSAFQILLPAVPSGQQGKKGETFKHALLDVFQTEFETICIKPPRCGQVPGQLHSNEEKQWQQEKGAILAAQRNHSEMRIHAIGTLAGHLLCHRLLGKGVVNQMVLELVEMGQAEVANKLLWFIGTVTDNAEQHQHLGTVLEDAGEA